MYLYQSSMKIKVIAILNYYFFQIIKDFADKDETKHLEFAKILQEVVDLMNTETLAQIFPAWKWETRKSQNS